MPILKHLGPKPNHSSIPAFVVVNPTDRYWTKHRYLLHFGAYGWTRLLVWANSLDDALDECVDWIADNEPGLLCDDSVNEEYDRAIADGLDEEAAHDSATVDTTCAGNNGHYLASWEWGIMFEDPTRQQLKALEAES
jgi:hypothetical protein